MALSRQPGVQTRPQIEILDPAQEETKSAYQELLDDIFAHLVSAWCLR